MEELNMVVRDGVARITFNRPHLMNAVPNEHWETIGIFLEGVEDDPDVRCVLFSGIGPNFCSGGDVGQFADSVSLDARERAARWMSTDRRTARLLSVLHRMGQPVVVAARGWAAGGGLGLIGMADLVIVSETAKLLAAQINIGAIPDCAVSYALVQTVGVRRAKQFCLLGEPIDAQTALALDLVNWVVKDDELEQRAEAIVARVVQAPRVATALTKASLNRAHRIALDEHLQQETRDVGACVVEEDFVDRVTAFIEKSKRRR